MKNNFKARPKPQLFATSWLGLGFAETPITADKREIKDFPKLPSATSFIRKTLAEIGRLKDEKVKIIYEQLAKF